MPLPLTWNHACEPRQRQRVLRRRGWLGLAGGLLLLLGGLLLRGRSGRGGLLLAALGVVFGVLALLLLVLLALLVPVLVLRLCLRLAEPALLLHLRLELGQVRVQFADVLVHQLVGLDGDGDLKKKRDAYYDICQRCSENPFYKKYIA